MRRGTRWAVVAVLSMLALAGCTGETEEPPTTPSATSAAPSPSETATATPTPDAATPPERPDMSVVDAATAEAVAKYFLELYPYVYATGDLTEWQALSHPECIFCASVISNVEEMVAAGEHWEGGLATLAPPRTTAVSSDFFSVTIEAEEAPARRVGADGATAEESTGGRSLMTVIVINEGGTWRVRGCDVGEPA